jgi:thioredoxin reductase (NADPH)
MESDKKEQSDQKPILIYGTRWCPDCRRSKQFLVEHQISIRYVDIEKEPEAEAFVIEKNQGKRTIPLILFPDGSFLSEPTNAQLAEKLQLKAEAKLRHYPLIIVGGGPAGLTAAIYTARDGIETLLIEPGSFGGQIANTERLDNFPGFPDGIDGIDLAVRLRRQALRFGVEFLETEGVAEVANMEKIKVVKTASGQEYSAESLLIASGSQYQKIKAPGETAYTGAGVHYCATCDGAFYKGKEVAVVGGGNSAAEEAIFLTRFADKVTLLIRKGDLKASKIVQEKLINHPKIAILYNTEVKEFLGDRTKLEKIKLKDNLTGQVSELAVPGVFVFIGMKPNSAFLKESGVLLDSFGFIITGYDLLRFTSRLPQFQDRYPFLMETSVPGVFAAGDVRSGSTKQAASAAGEGATVALEIREYLSKNFSNKLA